MIFIAPDNSNIFPPKFTWTLLRCNREFTFYSILYKWKIILATKITMYLQLVHWAVASGGKICPSERLFEFEKKQRAQTLVSAVCNDLVIAMRRVRVHVHPTPRFLLSDKCTYVFQLSPLHGPAVDRYLSLNIREVRYLLEYF